MRSAVILGEVAVPKITKMPPIQRDTHLLENRVKRYPACSAVRDALMAIYSDTCDLGVYTTLWVRPHLDNAGEITLGIIIEGDHYLFTGNNRRVGDLTPGTVFALLSQKMHGAYPRDWNNVTPLVFAGCVPDVSAEDWCKFCAEVSKKLNGIRSMS